LYFSPSPRGEGAGGEALCASGTLAWKDLVDSIVGTSGTLAPIKVIEFVFLPLSFGEGAGG